MDDEINLNSYIASIWRWKWFILAATALAGVVTTYFESKPATYTASALIQVGKAWKEPLEDLYTTSELINSDGFLNALASKLGTTPARLKNAVHAETITVGPQRASHPIMVRVTAGTGSPDESARLVQAAADEVISRHQKLYDQAMAPHLEHQRQLESAVAAGGRSADDMIKLLAALDEVKSNNTSPNITEKTYLIEGVTPGPVTKPALLRPTITACLIAGIISLFVAAAAGRLRSSEP
jgi:capsular polysaccharide biosynthesis protein